MNYGIKIKPRAIKDLKRIDKQDASKIADAIEKLQFDLNSPNIKKLTNFSPEYRLRIGNYRVLFEIENTTELVVYRIVHRKDAYR
ncbi:MAG: type II toxin-antitoxin system RelE/ParE family toxin [Kiritimatiellae bacterium]|jgi:mRNA interferase RelE/StbE|nr:type II toxin-antitoxin system RelE/ParE family toxin [Kiritimatiellia bacterium]